MSGRPAAPASRGGAGAMAWAGAVLFATSLGYFLFSYALTFGEIAVGPVSLPALAANVALFSIFAVHHSLFARERVRAWVARLLPESQERSLYVWTASLMLIAVCLLWQPIPGVAWQAPRPVAWLLHALQVFGVWLSLRSAAMLDIWELAGVRQAQRGTGAAAAPVFKTEGPYGWIRHPIYLGWFLIVFSVGTMTGTRLVFAVVSSVYVLVGIELEERSLRRVAGGGYADYMRQVPRKLLPGVY